MHNDYKNVEKQLIEYITLANHYNFELKDYSKAIEYYEKYLEIDKTHSSVFTVLANLYSKVYGDNSLEKQLWCYEQANLLKPDERLILHGLAFCSEKLEQNEKADKYYNQLLNNNPTPTDYYNYGCFLIHNGNFQKGHKYFAYRNLVNNEVFSTTLTPTMEDIERLQEDLTNKTILVHYEQGFGDTIMYSRFVPLLKNKVKKIYFVVQDELKDLIASSEIFEGIEILSNKKNISEIQYDVPVMLLDVPLITGVDSEDLPYSTGYLNIKTKEKDFSDNSFKIGISYSGDKNANYTGRDVGFNYFKSLLNFDGVKLYSLQKDSEKIEGVISLGKTFNNFTDTACAIKNMDLIVSTDNVILNLAGALGVKTIGLFNKQTNFRWFKFREDTGWYKSVKPLKARLQNEWAPVFEELKDIIKGLL